jgi:pantoate--beta-alanine ligase
MQLVTTVAAMQRLALRWRAQNLRVGFVPTMGYLHDGHLSLVRRASQAVGAKGRVIVSIYVNPSQFGPKEDLSRYPRDFARDRKLCREAGVDAIFAPADGEMYPPDFSTWVNEELLSLDLEGRSRPGHFRGVTTVVAKLFNIVLPHIAVFGAKDFQQAAVVKRMVRDLNFPLKLIIAPTQREPDGLALSSRNKYLTPAQRPQALALRHALDTARRAATRSIPAARLTAQLTKQISQHPDARVDYLAFFDPDTLAPAQIVRRGTHMALAVFVGTTRLIDNARL